MKSNLFLNYLREFRIYHWVKNLLILFPLVFSGNIRNIQLGKQSLIVFGLFSLLASAVYLLNDIFDVKHDRLHVCKKSRPIAQGLLSVKNALLTHFAILVVSMTGAYIYLGKEVLSLFVIYYLANVAYSLTLKKLPPLDIIVVALFYLLRPIIGAITIAVPVSNWLILTTFFAALFLVALKRYAELASVEDSKIVTRECIGQYTLGTLRTIGLLGLTVAIVSYGLYASTFPHFFIITIVPLTALALRLILLLDRECKIFENPEVLIFKDRIATSLFALWLLMVGYYHW